MRLRQHLAEIAAQTEPIASSRCNTPNENLYYYSVCGVMLSVVLAGSVASPLEARDSASVAVAATARDRKNCMNTREAQVSLKRSYFLSEPRDIETSSALCVCACACACVCVCVWIWTCVCKYMISLYKRVCLCVCVCTMCSMHMGLTMRERGESVCVCVCVSVCVCACISLYRVCMCVCILGNSHFSVCWRRMRFP